MFLLGYRNAAIAQDNSFDSLNTILSRFPLYKTELKNDTAKINVLVLLSEACELNQISEYTTLALQLCNKWLTRNPDKNLKKYLLDKKAISLNNNGFYYENLGKVQEALSNYNECLKIRQETGNKMNIAYTLNNIGVLYDGQGNIPLAIEYYSKSLQLQEEVGHKPGMAILFNNLALLFGNQGDIQKALSYHDKSFKIHEELGDKEGIALALHNIGNIYLNQDQPEKAFEYYNKSYNLWKLTGDKKGIANSLMNLGTLYNNQNDLSKALDYYKKSLALREEIGHNEGIAQSYNSLGVVYQKMGDLDKTLYYFTKSLELQKKIGDKDDIVISTDNLSRFYLHQKKYALARSFADTSLSISRSLGFPEHIRNIELTLSKIDSAMQNHLGAFEHYKQYIFYRDSINNNETRKASFRNQLNYEFEKKEAVMKEQQDKERLISAEKEHLQKIIIWSVVSGLFLVTLFSFAIYRSLQTARKQKLIIEEKQKEILDSIHYAKRIQKSLLPHEKYIEKILRQLKKY